MGRCYKQVFQVCHRNTIYGDLLLKGEMNFNVELNSQGGILYLRYKGRYFRRNNGQVLLCSKNTIFFTIYNILMYISSVNTWASGDVPLGQLVKHLASCLYLCVIQSPWGRLTAEPINNSSVNYKLVLESISATTPKSLKKRTVEDLGIFFSHLEWDTDIL